jgi:hypothetical protein
MSFQTVAHLVLPLYIIAGYISAYRMAKRTAHSPSARSGAVKRWGARLMVLLMPLTAFDACYAEWNASISLGEIFAIMVGMSMNLLFFYSGCITLMADKNTLLPRNPA